MITSDERLARRRALQDDLERQAARHALLSEKLGRARVLRDEAAAALKAAEAGVSRLQARCGAVERDCASIRRLAEFDSDTVNTLPVELLRAIWAEARPPEQPWKSIKDTRRLSELRMLLPSRLSAVCRHWRQVALNTPELWTDVGLPPVSRTAQHQKSFLEHVEHQMLRSHPRPLDIVLLHMNAPDEHTAVRCFESVLRTAGRHAARWSRVKFWFPPRLPANLLDDLLLGCSMPVLEDLHIVDSAAAAMTGTWLANAPSLHSFGIRGFIFDPPPLLQLRSVVVAHVDIDGAHTDGFWAALRALPFLHTLSLLLDSLVDEFPIPGAKVTLETLYTLKLRGSFGTYEALLAPTLSAPRLKRLNLEVGVVDAAEGWGRTFFAAFPSIDELELVGDGNSITHQHWVGCGVRSEPSRLTSLARLTHLKSVSFLNCRYEARKVEAARLHSRLFLALDVEGDLAAHGGDSCQDGTCPPPCFVWPTLESFAICAVSSVDAREELLDDFACFARTRAAACEKRGKKFSFALLNWPLQFPSWFREALGSMLGPAHVRLTTADGMSHAPLADPQEDEPEAEFTDSSEGSTSGDISSTAGSDPDDMYFEETEDEWASDSGSG